MSSFLGFDHIDARVPSLAAVEAFYDRLLPALGLSRTKYSHIDSKGDWYDVDEAHPANAKEYYALPEPGETALFMGIIEDSSMQTTRTRIAFRVATVDELVDWEARVRSWGARTVERSANVESYPALFFADPVGTRLELCARVPS